MVNDEFYQVVEQVSRDLYIGALKDVPPDVRAALAKAMESESSPTARKLLSP